MTNKEVIQKADIALSDLATAGKLNPEQTNRFIRRLIDQPTLLNRVRTVAMTAPEMKINKIGFGSRILRKAVSATALAGTYDAAVAGTGRSKPDINAVTLSTNEVIAEVNIPYDVIEDNIERGRVDGSLQEGAGGLHQTIVDLIAERASLDLEELILLGDTAVAGTDAYLGMIDGYLKRVAGGAQAGAPGYYNGYVVDVANAPISKDVMKAGLKTLPTKYQRNRSTMCHCLAIQNEIELRDQYGNRQTAMGDAQVQGNLPLHVFGSPVVPVALMPTSKGLFCDPQNLIFGIQRNIQIEYTKDIRARVFVVVLTARVAVQIEEPDAVVKYNNIA